MMTVTFIGEKSIATLPDARDEVAPIPFMLLLYLDPKNISQ
jgi:hypothetical protein